MSRMFPRGPSPLDSSLSNGLNAAKLTAWAIVVGEPSSSSGDPPLSRHHRGMLDDLPSPVRPVRAASGSGGGLFAALGRAFGFGWRPAALAASLSAVSKEAVGEVPEVTYIDAGAPEPVSGASQGTAEGQEFSRAA